MALITLPDTNSAAQIAQMKLPDASPVTDGTDHFASTNSVAQMAPIKCPNTRVTAQMAQIT